MANATATAAASPAAQETAPLPAQATTLAAAAIPTALSDEVRALVQQQLDAAGSQRLFWHGEVWPEQDLHWQVEWQADEAAARTGEEAEPWQTSLRLTTPRLGRMEAALHLGPAGVRINLQALDAASVEEMRAAAGRLAGALEAAGLPLRGFSVRQSADSAPPTDDRAAASADPAATDATAAAGPAGPHDTAS